MRAKCSSRWGIRAATARKYPWSAQEQHYYDNKMCSKNVTRASVAVWLCRSVSGGGGEELKDDRVRETKGRAEGDTTITTMSTPMLIGGHWRFKLRRARKKKIRTDAQTQTTAQMLIWNTHTHTQQRIYTNTPAGAAVPTESGWGDKCALKARLKESLREERLWQKCTPRDFPILLTFVFD